MRRRIPNKLSRLRPGVDNPLDNSRCDNRARSKSKLVSVSRIVLITLGLFLVVFSFRLQPASAAPDKSLIKVSNGQTVYWLQNNRIYGIITQNLLDTMRNNGMPGWTGS